jgi:hypothetical protein
MEAAQRSWKLVLACALIAVLAPVVLVLLGRTKEPSGRGETGGRAATAVQTGAPAVPSAAAPVMPGATAEPSAPAMPSAAVTATPSATPVAPPRPHGRSAPRPDDPYTDAAPRTAPSAVPPAPIPAAPVPAPPAPLPPPEPTIKPIF